MSAPGAVQPPVPGRVDRVVAALSWVLLGALLVVVVRLLARPVTVTDTLFHLRYGHEFLTHWVPWHPGHVSTAGQQRWWPTQWLSEIVMALVDDVAGLGGVVWLTGLVVVALVVVAHRLARRYADPLPAVVAVLGGVVGLLGTISPRPQVASLLLLLVLSGAWYRTSQDLRPRWWLVAMTWLWAMLHGMWPLAPVMGAVAVVGIALDHRRDLDRRALLRLAAVPVASLGVAAVTPVGPGLFRAVAEVGARGRFHTEWGPTVWTSPSTVVVTLMVLVTLGVWVARGPRSFFVLLLVVVSAGWAAYSMRTVAVAAMLLLAPTAAALQRLTGERRPVPPREPGRVLALGALALVVLAVLVPWTSADPDTAPILDGRSVSTPPWLNPALARLPAGTAVQTTDSTGGWLMWAHPDLDVEIDGYSDAYTTRHLDDELRILGVAPGWDTLVRRSGVHYALLPRDHGLARALEGRGWRVLHQSSDLVLLEGPST